MDSLLLSKGKKNIDTELNSLFQAKSQPLQVTKIAKKRKIPDVEPEVSLKRPKLKEPTDGVLKTKTKRNKLKPKEPQPSSDVDSDDNSDVETAYLQALPHIPVTPAAEKNPQDSDEENSQSDDGSDEEELPLVHESLQKKRTKAKPKPKLKFTPSDETKEQRDARTIFIGNISVEVATKKPLLKALQRHILSFVPAAKIESTRFRSVPFETPTAKLENDIDTPAGPLRTTSLAVRPHDRERTSSWRKHGDAAAEGDEVKQYLNPAQKKRVAFINQAFHTSADTMHAYMVFAHPVPPTNTEAPTNLPPPKPTLDPYEAATIAASNGDSSLFMERMIRVDVVRKSTSFNASEAASSSSQSNIPSTNETNPKLSIFVGNLDFATKEEDLRVFFEGIVSAERGPPGTNDDKNTSPTGTWVTRVRIIRDKDTQLGKGFGYIQFSDRACVDEVVSLDETKLRFAKRKLRVQRCKAVTKSSMPTAAAAVPRSRYTLPATPIPIPRGDPALGTKIAHLPKEERKKVKSEDAERVKRRMAKKEARMKMKTPKTVAGGAGGVPVKLLGRDKGRERSRKAGGRGPNKGFNAAKQGNGRTRSDKSMAKRHVKK